MAVSVIGDLNWTLDSYSHEYRVTVDGIALRFTTTTDTTRNGSISVSDAMSVSGAQRRIWISRSPGGPPVDTNAEISGVGALLLNWAQTPTGTREAILQAGTTYYLNLSADMPVDSLVALRVGQGGGTAVDPDKHVDVFVPPVLDLAPIREGQSAFEVYRANLANPENLESLRFWARNELNKIQSSFYSADDLMRQYGAQMASIVDALQGISGSVSVTVKGPQGDPGPVGPMGPQGAQGPKGDDGNAADLIDDAKISYSFTWSSQKIKTELDGKSDKGHKHVMSDITDLDAVPEAPVDGTPYVRQDASWMPGVLATDFTTHITDTDIHFSDAPSDGNQYARKDGGWEVVASSGGFWAASGNDIYNTNVGGVFISQSGAAGTATSPLDVQAPSNAIGVTIRGRTTDNIAVMRYMMADMSHETGRTRFNTDGTFLLQGYDGVGASRTKYSVSTTSNCHVWHAPVSGAEVMRMTDIGLGIKVTNPRRELEVHGAEAGILMKSTVAPADHGLWQAHSQANYYRIRCLNDAFSLGVNAYQIVRSGTTPTRHSWFTADTEKVRIDGSGALDVGITGNTNAGAAACNGWFRSYGQTGWLNQTYSGGWFMKDSTWVRSYNNKKIYCGSTADDAFATPGDITSGYSDIRLKDIEAEVEAEPEDFLDLDCILYRDNDLAVSLGYGGDELKIGFNAQQWQSKWPELIKSAAVNIGRDTDYITIDYSHANVPLVAAFKKLVKRHVALEQRMTALEETVYGNHN